VGQTREGFALSLLAGAVALGLSLFGFSGLFGRPDVPWDELAQETGIPADLLRGAAIRVDGFDVRDTEFDFKFIASRHRIGDPVEFVFTKDGGEVAARAALVPYYFNRRLPLVYFLTGLVGFVIGFAVFIRRREDPQARLFYWLCVAFSSAVVISGAWYGLQGRALFLVPGALFYIAYALTPVILLRFTLTFSARERLPGAPFLWGASILFGLFFAAVLVAAFLIPSMRVFRLMTCFVVFRFFFVVLSAWAVVVLFLAYRAAGTREARDQVRWVFYGIVGGLGMTFYEPDRTDVDEQYRDLGLDLHTWRFEGYDGAAPDTHRIVDLQGERSKSKVCPQAQIERVQPWCDNLRAYYQGKLVSGLKRLIIDYEPPVWNVCFCDRCRAAFAKRFELAADECATLPADELTAKYPEQWGRFRAEQNGAIVKLHCNLIHEIDPEAAVGLCSWNGTEWTAGRGGDIALFEPEAAFHAPMVYTSGTAFHDIVRETCERTRVPVLPFIELSDTSQPRSLTPEQLRMNLLATG